MIEINEESLPFVGNNTSTLTMPPSGNKIPAVILLHGFASHKDEVGGFFTLLSQSLASANFASLRFTFKNFELPDDVLVESTLDEMITEVDAAFAALAAIPKIDANRIGLLGFSLGGAVAIQSAAQHSNRYKALVTWSCAADLVSSFRKLVGAKMFDRAIVGEESSLDLGWRKIRLGPSFFKSLSKHAPLEKIKSFHYPFLGIAGSEDYLSTYLDQYYQSAPGTTKDKLMIKGADHIFNILETPARFAPLVIEKTTSWFASHL